MSVVVDAGLALRLSWHRRWSMVATIAILAIGLISTAALFIVLDALILQPLPFKDPGQLYVVGPSRDGAQTVPNRAPERVTQRELLDLATLPGVTATFGFCERGGVVSDEARQGEDLRDASVTSAFFSGLGVRPMLGRPLTDLDIGVTPPRVLISYSLWVSRFAADQRAIAQWTTLGGNRVEVVGVMPPRFNFPSGANLWSISSTSIRSLVGVARASRGILRPDALRFSDRPGTAMPLSDYLHPTTDKTLPLTFLLVLAIITLAMTWLHLGALRAVQIFDHARDTAVRMAIGASSWQVIRQHVVENLLFVVATLAVAVLFLPAAVSVAARLLPPTLTVGREIGVDARGLLFLGSVTLLGLLVMTIGPARATTRPSLLGLLKNEGQTISSPARTRRRRAVLIAQVGLVSGLLYVTGVLATEMMRMRRFDLGFNPDGLLTVTLPEASRAPAARDTANGQSDSRSAKPAPGSTLEPESLQRDLVHEIGGVPGVTAVATGFEPFYTPGMGVQVGIDGASSTQRDIGTPNALYQMVSPGYFRTIGTPILEGRDFDWALDGGRHVAIISRSLARALGRPTGLAGSTVWINGGQYAVLGVVGDIRANVTDALGERPYLYWLAPRLSPILVRVSDERRGGVVSRIAAIVRAVTHEPKRPSFANARQRVAQFVAPHSSRVALVAMQAGAALLLSVLGLYALASEVLRQRLRSMAVRKAFGASPRQIFVHLSGPVAIDAAIGLALGLVLGIVAASWLWSAALIGSGLAVFDIRAALLAIVPVSFASLFALLGPARRAARLDPSVLLRVAQ